MSSSIGVLITYHNEKELLSECLESLLAQTRLPDEVLIHDDASDAPAEEYVPSGCPVKIMRVEVNRGPSYSRNALLKESQSDYVHFHDSDDFFHPNWCERVHQLIEESRADVIFTEASLHRDGVISEGVLKLDQLIAGKDLIQFIIESFGYGVPIGTYRRDKVQAIGGYTESLWYGEDLDFHTRLAQNGISYVSIDESLVNIRHRSSSHSHRNRFRLLKGNIMAILKVADELPARYGDDLAERMAERAIELYRMGYRSEGRDAIKLAHKLGRPNYNDQRHLYRFLANKLGLDMAEFLGVCYRRLIPHIVRKYIARGRLF